MRRRRTVLLASLLGLVGVGAAIAWAVSREPDDGLPDLPEDEEPVIEVAEVVPGTDVPELWGPDEIGTTSCESEQITRRVRYEFDDRHRLVRQHTWRRARRDEPDAELRPWEVTRWSYGQEGMEVQVRRASRSLSAEDPYAAEAPADLQWEVTEARVTYGVRGEWLHQRTVTGDDERESLFRLEEGRPILRSPLRAEDALPESDHCLFAPDGRPLRFRDAAGEETRWTYDEAGRLSAVEQYPASGEPPTLVPVRVDEEGGVTVLLERYVGDCAEVIFEPCSSVLEAMPGPPLPEGILPTDR